MKKISNVHVQMYTCNVHHCFYFQYKKKILEDKNQYTIKKIMLFWGWIYVYMYKEI